MKKIILLISLLALLLSNSLNAQETEHEYIPMAVEGAQWLISYDKVDTYLYIDVYYGFKVERDTIINGVNYKKVYCRLINYATEPEDEPPYTPSSYQLFGAIRDDIETKQVYGIAFSNDDGYDRCDYTSWMCSLDEEVLMYDFSLGVEDDFGEMCMIGFDTSPINQAMDQYLFGTWRFTQVTLNSVSTLEGVGNEHGLFEFMMHEVSGWYHNIEGYCVGSDSECWGDWLVGIENIDLTDKITLSPNPVTKVLYIKNAATLVVQSVRIYNILGKLLYEENKNYNEIAMEILESGVLYVIIETDSGNFTQKIIKQ